MPLLKILCDNNFRLRIKTFANHPTYHFAKPQSLQYSSKWNFQINKRCFVAASEWKTKFVQREKNFYCCYYEVINFNKFSNSKPIKNKYKSLLLFDELNMLNRHLQWGRKHYSRLYSHGCIFQLYIMNGYALIL